MKKNVALLMLLVLLGTGFRGEAKAAPIIPLPDPGSIGKVPDSTGTLRDAYFIDGVPVAIKHDDMWSYSAKLLDAVQAAGHIPLSHGNYQFTTGTGSLDALLYTGSGGASNENIGPSGTTTFEEPVINPSGSATSFEGWWGQADQNNDTTPDTVSGPVTVGQVLNYLHDFDPTNDIPVFFLDVNQTGNAPSLLLSANIFIFDPTTATIVENWALDAVDDGHFNETDMTLAAGKVTLAGASGTVYNVNHNLGSGKPDFIVFSPDMDLSGFDPSHYLVTEFHMGGINGGFEEIFLTGQITAAPLHIPTPEPSTLLLLGMGLIAFTGIRRRLNKDP